MFECDWDINSGWKTPKIIPFGDFKLPPSCSALHYAIQCFEGLKAYSDTSGKDEKYLFRPTLNASRFNSSSHRISLPVSYFNLINEFQKFKEEEFIKCLGKLLELESDWIPNKRGQSIYIRPAHISTEVII